MKSFSWLCVSVALFPFVALLTTAQLSAQDCNRALPPNDPRDCNQNGFADDCDLAPLTPAFRALKEAPTALSPFSFNGVASWSLATADLDGDRLQDLAVIDNASRSIRIFWNLDGGTFQEASVHTGVEHQYSILAEDLDGDGRLDLAVGNSADDYFFVLTNIGGRRFGPQKGATTGGGPYRPYFLRSGDVDLDGTADLLLFNTATAVAFLSNRGDGTFGPPTPSNVRIFGFDTAELADLDGDGDLDAAVAEGPLEGTVAPLLNDGHGIFALGTRLAINGNSNSDGAQGLALKDFNSDGRIDVVTTAYDAASRSHKLVLSLNSGQGKLRQPVVIGSASAPNFDRYSTASVEASDLDGDSDVDLLAVTAFPTSELRVYSNETASGGSTPTFKLWPAADRAFEADVIAHAVGKFSSQVGAGLAAFRLPKGFAGTTVLSVLQFDRIPFSSDCDHNQIPDECDIASGRRFDCDKNGIPDQCDGLPGLKEDCNRNGIPDACELETKDCNATSLPDDCDIAAGDSVDQNKDAIPDECQNDSFVFAFTGPGEVRSGGPIMSFELEYACIMIPPATIAESGEGAQGWSFGAEASGFRITSVTMDGTVAASVADEPPGLVDAGFRRTELTSGEGNEGVVSAIVLSVLHPITLPAHRASVILRLRVSGTTPPAGQQDAYLKHRDGLKGSGQPVFNQVTRRGSTYPVILNEKHVLLSSQAAPFRRGDSNADGHIDISDAIYTLSWLFLGGAAPPCLDAADFDDSGDIDISDGHGINVFLFLGSSVPPAPGPFVCGSDSTEDSLTCVSGACGE